MKTQRIFPKQLFLSGLLLCLIVPVILSGCWSYVNKDAMQSFNNSKDLISVTVYPVNIFNGSEMKHDSELAGTVVNFLQKENLAKPILGTVNHTYPFKWGMNQAKMSKQSAEAFATQVKNDNIQTDYALLVELLTPPNENPVIGVSYYLVDKTGRIANGTLSNSDWEDFRAVNPLNRRDGVELALIMLKKGLVKGVTSPVNQLK
jgi:hypothetical protein